MNNSNIIKWTLFQHWWSSLSGQCFVLNLKLHKLIKNALISLSEDVHSSLRGGAGCVPARCLSLYHHIQYSTIINHQTWKLWLSSVDICRIKTPLRSDFSRHHYQCDSRLPEHLSQVVKSQKWNLSLQVYSPSSSRRHRLWKRVLQFIVKIWQII